MRSPFNLGNVLGKVMLTGRGAAVTLATSAGGSEEGRLVNRVVVQEPVQLSGDDALDRDVINRRRSTLQYLCPRLYHAVIPLPLYSSTIQIDP